MDIAALIFAQLAVLGSALVEAIAIDALDVRMADLIRVISGAQIGALSIGVARSLTLAQVGAITTGVLRD